MPQIGEIRRAREIGRDGNQSNKYIYLACPNCGKERWVFYRRDKEQKGLCGKCSRRIVENRGTGGWGKSGIRGKFAHKRGYWLIKLDPTDFFYPTANYKGEIFEHRLVMARHLGRNLHRWEIIHHRNGNKGDNRIENLQLVSDDRHNQITLLERRIKYLEKLLIKKGIPF